MDPVDSDCTPLYEIQQPSAKSSKKVPITLLDVSELLIVKMSVPGSCNSQNAANNATISENTDFLDEEIVILHESARKANFYAAQNKEKAKSESESKNHPNNKNIGTRTLDEVAIENKSSNLSNSKYASRNDDILTVKVIRQNEGHRAARFESKRQNVLDNGIRIVDDVTIEEESCSPEPETKSKIIEEDDDIIMDAIILKFKTKHSTPVSTSQGEGILDNNARILHKTAFKGDCRNLTKSMSTDKDVPSNDVVVLDIVPCVNQHCNSGRSKSKNRHILENDIKILTVSSITNKEYDREPEFKAENKCNDDNVMVDIGIAENNFFSSQESMLLENSKNYSDIQGENENMIQCCNLPVATEMKSILKLNTKDRKNFIGQVGHFSVKPKHEVKQSPEKSISCYNEVGYSSNRCKYLSEESSSNNKKVSRQINCSFDEKNEKSQNEFSVTRKEYSSSPKPNARKKSIPFYEEIILDADITTNSTLSSPESTFTQNSKNSIDIQWKNVNKKQSCDLPIVREVKSGINNTTEYGKSCIVKVRHSSVIQKDKVKMNDSLFDEKEKSQENQNESSISRKEYNPFLADITEKKPPSSQKSTIAQNAKNDTGIQVENQDKIQYCSLPVVKKMKIGVTPAMKDERNFLNKVRHSSVVEKCKVGQTSMKAVSCNCEVGCSTRGNKSLAEELIYYNSVKDRSISRDMNSSLFEKKEESNKNQNGFPTTIEKNNRPPESKAQSIQFVSFDDGVMDVDKTENIPPTSKEPSFAHNSKCYINIQDENQNSVQCCRLSDVKKVNSSVKTTTTCRKNNTGKVKHSSVNKKCEVEQLSIKPTSCNNKEWNSFKKNKSLTEESNPSNSNKVRSYLENVNCSLLEKKVGSEKSQATCSTTNATSQDSNYDFDSGYKCIWCSFATPDKEVMENHMEEMHSDSEKIKCPFCYSKPTNHQYFNHINRHLGKPPYLCQQCPYSTASVNYFVSHLTCHKQASPKKFYCKHCSFSTDIRLEFTQHKAVHASESEVIRKQGKTLSCKVCNKTFHYKMHLVQHQKIHKDEQENAKKSAESNRPLFVCESCDFSAGREMTLKRHQNVHHPKK